MKEAIETPSILIYDEIIKQNIKFIQDKANFYNINVRPHIKTHKSIFLANQQIEAGAIGITASKVSEAMVFIDNGFKNITIAYPIISKSKLKTILMKADVNNVHLNLIVDSLFGFHILCDSLVDTKLTAHVFLKINTGLNRCGVDKGSKLLTNLAYYLDAEPTIIFKGILSHAGHSYSSKNLEELDLIIQEEIAIMQEVKAHLESKNISVEQVSIGATPTVLRSTNFDGITEIRPGNYILNDQTPLNLELINESQVALRVLTTIISENEYYYIIDTGSKLLTSDKGAHGNNSIHHYGTAKPINNDYHAAMPIEKLSEEHGFIAKTDAIDLAIGDQLLIIPNHSCAVMNQCDFFYYFTSQSYKKIPIEARGKYE